MATIAFGIQPQPYGNQSLNGKRLNDEPQWRERDSYWQKH
jgi:hypothetical protein